MFTVKIIIQMQDLYYEIRETTSSANYIKNKYITWLYWPNLQQILEHGDRLLEI